MTEVEKLRADLERARQMHRQALRDLEAARAEVERLKARLAKVGERVGDRTQCRQCGWRCPKCETGTSAYALNPPKPCTLCGGAIGPDITGRPMCYGCGPANMRPSTEELERMMKRAMDRLIEAASRDDYAPARPEGTK